MINLLIKTEPIATLSCYGAVTAIDIGSDVGDYCRQVFIMSAAEQTSDEQQATCEWWQEYRLLAVLGVVPFPEDLKAATVKGWIEVERDPSTRGSFWTHDSTSPDTCYRILDAFMFETPIELEQLSQYKVRNYAMRPSKPLNVSDDTLRLTVSDLNWLNCYPGNTLTLPPTEKLRCLLLNGTDIVPFKFIVVANGNREKKFVYGGCAEVFTPLNGDESEQTIFSTILNQHIPDEYIEIRLGELV